MAKPGQMSVIATDESLALACAFKSEGAKQRRTAKRLTFQLAGLVCFVKGCRKALLLCDYGDENKHFKTPLPM